MVNDRPKITVLMTVYNGEKTLRRAIESILLQTFRDFEFLIINDCSADGTVDMVGSYNDDRIKLHTNEVNVGQTKSLNIGLGLVESEYIARMDADDYSMPERLEKQYSFIKKHPEYVVVGTDCLVVDEFGNKKSVSKGCVKQDDIILRMLYGSPINHVSVLMKSEVVRNLGGYNPEFVISADFDLWSRLVRNGYKLTTIPEVLTVYTFSDGSYSYKNVLIKNKEVVDVIYNNACAFSNYVIDKDDAMLIMQTFSGGIVDMTDENILRSESLFKNIILNMKPEYGSNIDNGNIKNLLRNNYQLAVYHLILGKCTSRARQVATKYMLSNGFSPQALMIYFSTFLGPNCVKKLNYYRAKYL